MAAPRSRAGRMAARAGEAAQGRIVRWTLALLRRVDPDRASRLCGAAARLIGPRLRAHRIGRDNLRAAFPDADDAWIEATLRGAWDNLGRVAGEYAHMARIAAEPDRLRSDAGPLVEELLADGRPALCFSAHLGNWEVPAVAAAQAGLPSAAVYRMPNNRAVAEEILRIRGPLMGRLIRTRPQAAHEMVAALEQGLHLGMLVDQHFSRGVDCEFFGRPVKANPAVARLARRFDCPVVGARVVRREGGFDVLAEGPFDLPRDAEGLVDVVPATQMMLRAIERWVREHPDQYLWFHRRWR